MRLALFDLVKIALIALSGYVSYLNGAFAVWMAIILTIAVMVSAPPAGTARERE